MTQDPTKIDDLAEGPKHYARILRGEAQDLTGIGAWRIWCNHLSEVMDCKVI